MIVRQWPRLAAAALGFVWYLQLGGGPTLWPTNVDWLFDGDWRQHWLGWLFFRDTPWTFPLGGVNSLLYPVGTMVGFTDSNPLVSILLKPFSSVLPREVQFIGPWLALCFALQGYFGAALTSTITKDKGQQVLGGYLFALSPVLAMRVGHDTLCAQWLLVALLYLGFREYSSQRDARRALWWTAAAVVFAAATHPYLAAMCVLLALAVCIRLWRDALVPLPMAGLGAAVVVFALLGTFGIIGYFGSANASSSGFGLKYSADLLTLFNPDDFSKFLGRLPKEDSQWEGLGFLGLGGVLALAAGLLALTRHRPGISRGMWTIVAAALALAFYSLSSHITFGGREIVNLDWLYAPVTTLASAFRSSGRFVWTLHYLVLFFGIWGVIRLFGREALGASAGTAALAALVTLQAADLRVDTRLGSPKKAGHVPVATFDLAQGKYEHLALFPAQVLGYCSDPYEEDYTYRFMMLAYRLGLTYNSGIYARLDGDSVRRECNRLDQNVSAGALDPKTIYVVAPAHVDRFKTAGAGCGRWNGTWYCVSKDSDARFRTWVATGK